MHLILPPSCTLTRSDGAAAAIVCSEAFVEKNNMWGMFAHSPHIQAKCFVEKIHNHTHFPTLFIHNYILSLSFSFQMIISISNEFDGFLYAIAIHLLIRPLRHHHAH